MNGRLQPWWVVVIGATLGAVATCLWLGAGVAFPGKGALEPKLGAPHTLQSSHVLPLLPAVQPQNSMGVSPRPLASIPVRTETASTSVRDDSTYLRMLELAVSRDDGTEVIRKINDRHERSFSPPMIRNGGARRLVQAPRHRCNVGRHSKMTEG